MFNPNSLKAKVYYKIISKDKHNGYYFWIDNLYIVNSVIIEFNFFYSIYTMSWLQYEDSVSFKPVFKDLYYIAIPIIN